MIKKKTWIEFQKTLGWCKICNNVVNGITSYPPWRFSKRNSSSMGTPGGRVWVSEYGRASGCQDAGCVFGCGFLFRLQLLLQIQFWGNFSNLYISSWPWKVQWTQEGHSLSTGKTCLSFPPDGISPWRCSSQVPRTPGLKSWGQHGAHTHAASDSLKFIVTWLCVNILLIYLLLPYVLECSVVSCL